MDFSCASQAASPDDSLRNFDHEGYLGPPPKMTSERIQAFTGSAADIFIDLPEDEEDSFPFTQVSSNDPGSEIEQELAWFIHPDDSHSHVGNIVTESPLEEVNSSIRAESQDLWLKEWERRNALYLQEKRMYEKERISQLNYLADMWKEIFYHDRAVYLEPAKLINRKKEQDFVTSQQQITDEPWKAVAKLLPKAYKRMEGPKPGAPTDLRRMHSILMKLKDCPRTCVLPPAPGVCALS